MMKRILFAVLCLAPALCFAQRIAIDVKDGYRKLTWNDFKGAADTGSTLPAVTYCHITWQADTERARQNKGGFPPLEAVVSFTGRSWANTKHELTPAMLRHEQGHFDIAITCAAELQQRFNEAAFTSFETAMPEVTRLYRETLEKCNRMRSKYAIATANGKNSIAQSEWEAYLAKELARYLPALAGN